MTGIEAIRPIIGAPGDTVLALSITIMIHDWTNWPIDWELFKNECCIERLIISSRSYLLPVYTQPGDLRVKVREVAPGQQRIVAKANSWDDVTSAESDLLGF